MWVPKGLAWLPFIPTTKVGLLSLCSEAQLRGFPWQGRALLLKACSRRTSCASMPSSASTSSAPCPSSLAKFQAQLFWIFLSFRNAFASLIVNNALRYLLLLYFFERGVSLQTFFFSSLGDYLFPGYSCQQVYINPVAVLKCCFKMSIRHLTPCCRVVKVGTKKAALCAKLTRFNVPMFSKVTVCRKPCLDREGVCRNPGNALCFHSLILCQSSSLSTPWPSITVMLDKTLGFKSLLDGGFF